MLNNCKNVSYAADLSITQTIYSIFPCQCIYMHLHAFTLPSVWPPSNNNIGRFLMIFSGPEMGSLPACRPAPVLGCPASTDGIARPLPLVKSLALQRSLRTRCHHHLKGLEDLGRFDSEIQQVSLSVPAESHSIPLCSLLHQIVSMHSLGLIMSLHMHATSCHIMLHHATSGIFYN